MALLTEAFPRVEMNSRIYYEILRDLPDEAFKLAVLETIRGIKEIFPGTNLMAILRGRTLELQRELLEKRANERGISEEAQPAPPPPEWEGLKRKLGINKVEKP